jgi:hypothetical protein
MITAWLPIAGSASSFRSFGVLAELEADIRVEMEMIAIDSSLTTSALEACQENILFSRMRKTPQ